MAALVYPDSGPCGNGDVDEGAELGVYGCGGAQAGGGDGTCF